MALLAAALLDGCASLGYAVHVARGELSLLARREPLDRAIRDPRLTEHDRALLRQAEAARRFASDQLDLPRNRSYTTFVALDRPYVTWNVLATREFSVEPIRHCFPLTGCVAYQGYFDEDHARRAAKRLQERGDDTWIEGAAAFSTLGWFADPVLGTMLRWDADTLDRMIFHELAHQEYYLAGDTTFNESFASFVGRQGLCEWHRVRGVPDAIDDSGAFDTAFARRVLDLRDELAAIYAQRKPPGDLRAGKQAAIESFRAAYAPWRDHDWPGHHRYDAWVAGPINNAKLLPFGLYEQWIPAFAQMFRDADGQWRRFYDEVAATGALSAAARDARLLALADQGIDERAPVATMATCRGIAGSSEVRGR
ncbi:MAG: aminopeptidase [Lysobacterales bacterium]